jgi:hypothetical protein
MCLLNHESASLPMKIDMDVEQCSNKHQFYRTATRHLQKSMVDPVVGSHSDQVNTGHRSGLSRHCVPSGIARTAGLPHVDELRSYFCDPRPTHTSTELSVILNSMWLRRNAHTSLLPHCARPLYP